ncbi:MAG TPA: LysR family transcriptional regulator [Burkholderiaceae bacterium]|nr:LysR family transcriptional regulator [Burkholderiaceae bacterium]
MFDWDDLKFLLAVAQHGSTLAAARALEVNQSTVQRRLAELQRCIGRRMVERQQSGYRLTEFGLALLPAAQGVHEAVHAFERQVHDTLRDAEGVVRVTCPEPLMYRITRSPLLQRLAARHPKLKVEFVMSDRYIDLEKGEADVALRSGDTDDGELVGRKIGDSLWGVYASKAYLAHHGRPQAVQELAQHALIGLDDSMVNHRAAVWLRRVAPHAKLVARNNSVLGMVYAVKSGLGLAPLPLAVGDAEPELERVLGPVPELTRDWRILTLPELRHQPRVAAFFDFIVDEIETLRPSLTG